MMTDDFLMHMRYYDFKFLHGQFALLNCIDYRYSNKLNKRF